MILILISHILHTIPALQLSWYQKLDITCPPRDQMWNSLSPTKSNLEMKTKTITRLCTILHQNTFFLLLSHNLHLRSDLCYIQVQKSADYLSKNPRKFIKSNKTPPILSLHIFKPVIITPGSLDNFNHIKENIEQGSKTFIANQDRIISNLDTPRAQKDSLLAHQDN